VLPIDAGGRIRIADVSARAIARPATAVVPATSVLGDVAAEGALVTDLRGRHTARGGGEQWVAPAHFRMLDDLRQRGGGADLEPTIGSLAYAPQLLDRSDVDDDRGTLRPILQPVEGVHTP